MALCVIWVTLVFFIFYFINFLRVCLSVCLCPLHSFIINLQEPDWCCWTCFMRFGKKNSSSVSEFSLLSRFLLTDLSIHRVQLTWTVLQCSSNGWNWTERVIFRKHFYFLCGRKSHHFTRMAYYEVQTCIISEQHLKLQTTNLRFSLKVAPHLTVFYTCSYCATKMRRYDVISECQRLIAISRWRSL